MSARGRIARVLLAVLAATTLTSVAASTSAAAPPRPSAPSAPSQIEPTLTLVNQTPAVGPGQRFDLAIDLGSTPSDGSVEITLHGRVRSRSELATSIDGTGLRPAVYTREPSVAELPTHSDGSRRISISLDPDAGLAITAPGAYPVVVTAKDSEGAALSSLITHLLLEPTDDEFPPLAVAVVADIDAPPALLPDGTVDVDPRALEGAEELATVLADSPGGANLAIRAETVEALAASDEPAHATLLEALRGAAAAHATLVLPYADVSPEGLQRAGLGNELANQLDRSRQVLRDLLDAEPVGTTWLAGSDLGPIGVATLARAGLRHVVVRPEQVEDLRPGVVTLSLAQPFLVGARRGADPEEGLDALALDRAITDRLDTTASPGLEVSRLLAELAVLWFERPGIARATVLPVDTSVRPEVVGALLRGLDSGVIFESVPLDEAFTTAAPLVQPGGLRVDRELIADDPGRISPAVARDFDAARRLLASFTDLLGADSADVVQVARHLLLSTSVALDPDEQLAHLDAARTVVAEVVGAVSAPSRETITLTAREGTVPLTIRNDTGHEVQAVVRLRSPKLEFPDGETRSITLTDRTTRLDISVRARASGSFPLHIEVTSPDGAVLLTATDYSIQSTAVSGAGVILSAGAALFLLVWWARHWSRTRRSTKLVPPDHRPAHAAPRKAPQ